MDQPERTTALAIEEAFNSINELDRNMEIANVVDGLFAIARAIERLAVAVDKLPISSD